MSTKTTKRKFKMIEQIFTHQPITAGFANRFAEQQNIQEPLQVAPSFPLPLPAGSWATEQFNISYSYKDIERWPGGPMFPGSSLVCAASKKDTSQTFFYFQHPSGAYEENHRNFISTIGESKDIHFNIDRVVNRHKEIRHNCFMGIQEYDGTCFHETLGSGTWKAVFTARGDGLVGSTPHALITISFGNDDNAVFFKEVRECIGFQPY